MAPSSSCRTTMAEGANGRRMLSEIEETSLDEVRTANFHLFNSMPMSIGCRQLHNRVFLLGGL